MEAPTELVQLPSTSGSLKGTSFLPPHLMAFSLNPAILQAHCIRQGFCCGLPLFQKCLSIINTVKSLLLKGGCSKIGEVEGGKK